MYNIKKQGPWDIMGFNCKFHKVPIPCPSCAKVELIKCEAENKQRRLDGVPEHDLRELRKIAMQEL